MNKKFIKANQRANMHCTCIQQSANEPTKLNTRTSFGLRPSVISVRQSPPIVVLFAEILIIAGFEINIKLICEKSFGHKVYVEQNTILFKVHTIAL